MKNFCPTKIITEENNVHKCPTRRNYTQFILSANCSTCFQWSLHPSFAYTANSLKYSMIATDGSNGWPVPDAVDTVICAPDDGWRNHLKHVEQFTDKLCIFIIVRVIKSRRMRWAGHVARMGEGRGVYRVLVGKPEGRNHWGDLGVDGRIILGWISRKWDMCIWTGLGWPRIETGGGRLWVR